MDDQYEIEDWNNLELHDNVLLCLAVSPKGWFDSGNVTIVGPETNDVYTKELVVNHRNSAPVR